MFVQLEFQDDRSHKFWEIRVEGDAHVVRYGRVGTQGQTKTKTFASNELATKAAEKLVESKRKKGYVDATTTGFDLEGLLVRLGALPFGEDGQPLPGHAIRYDGGPARLAVHRVHNPVLGLEIVRLFHLERGDELVAFRAGCEQDGVYFLDHEAGLFSVEELDGDTGVFEDVLDFTNGATWADLDGSQRIAILEEELGIEAMGDLFDRIEVETWEVAPAPQLDAAVRQVIAPGEAHGELMVTYEGNAHMVSFGRLLRIEEDGTPTDLGECGRGAVGVFDGALYVSGKTLVRYSSSGGLESLDIAADVPRVRSLCAHDGELWAGCEKGVLARLVEGILVREHVLDGADSVMGLCSTEEGLWIAPWKKGLKLLDGKGALKSGGVRAGRLRQVLRSSTGAMLVVCQGKDGEPGCLYRREPGAKKFEKHPLADGVCVKLAQLDSGRLVGAGLWNEVFVSDDDGCTFASIDHGFHGLTGGQPSNRNFDSVVAVGDEALLAGAFAPTLAVR